MRSSGGYRPKVYEVYPAIAETLAPEYAEMDAEDFRQWIEKANIDLEILEGLWKKIADFGKQAIPVAAPIVGGLFAGPMGAAIGSQVGGLAAAALGPSQKPGPPAPQVPFVAPGMPQAPVPSVPGGLPSVTGGSPAAAQLLQLLFRPEFRQALMAMTMGHAGAPNIKVGSHSVPPSAFTHLVKILAKEATEEYNAFDYAIRPDRREEDYAGEKIDDPAESALRSQKLLRELHESSFRPKRIPSFKSLSEQIPEFSEMESQVDDELMMLEVYADPLIWG
jgi:hypothetical protein